MIKHLKNIPILSYHNRPLKVPKRNEDREIAWVDRDKGIPETEEATLAHVLMELVLQFPPSGMTVQDSLNGGRLYNQVWESLKNIGLNNQDDGFLDLENAEWSWAIKKLEDDKIGPQILRMNCAAVLEQLRELERISSNININTSGPANGHKSPTALRKTRKTQKSPSPGKEAPRTEKTSDG